jgi:hypothetical protein
MMKDNIVKARSHIVFLLGLICAFSLAWSLESIEPPQAALSRIKSKIVPSRNVPELAAPRALESWELQAAETAWQYFENNYRPETGLVNSVDGYPASTLWDTASYMMALIAAQRLNLVPRDVFHVRMSKLLESLAAMDLYDDQLPNKSYNTVSLDMVDYTNKITDRGIGWSAIDVGRVLVPFNVIAWNYPEHTAAATRVLQKWQFDALVSKGEMIGAQVDAQGQTEYVQEGRLGYEEYASKSISLLGKDLDVAFSYENNLRFVDVYGIKVATDAREPEIFNAHNYVVSEPYILDGIEYGWDTRSSELAWRVFSAQKARYRETGVLTAVSEDNIDQAPYFVYNTVYTSGKIWNTITEDGEDASEFRSLSTKAAIGWHMLYRDEYTQQLIDAIGDNFDPEKGWYSGIYEETGEPNKAITANTNGIILEAIAFARFGKLVSIYRQDT